ncbi:hypothetical protein [Costertonia aggregata]|uniref:Uncharacterized protein n=1 Tax=Costertonia aggregata TaxID=343403 RepID=A0A7H9ARG9_9FLAO|nr:hypothetical protein [Costertonia aggregata]QLG46030.1 hypothetical protein HYG79_11975 [Costertonia aggregata]
MGLYEYKLLDDTEQWNLLWDKGTFLIHCIEVDKKYSLYALYNFFVEVELDNETSRIIAKKHFKTGGTLDKYSGNVDISNL